MTAGPVPSASVVIPVRDGAPVLHVQLAALAAQAGIEAAEVIVADNGSTDPTPDVAGKLGAELGLDLRVIDASGRRGAGPARNRGVAEARSDRLVFCDADDQVGPGWLAAHLRSLDRHELSIGATVDRGPGESDRHDDHTWPGSPTRWEPFVLVPGNNFAIRRPTFDQLGGFDERFLTGQDAELGFRADQAGTPWVFTPDARVLRTTRDGLRSRIRRSVQYGRGNATLAEVHPAFTPVGDWWGDLRRATLRLPLLVASPRHRDAWARRLAGSWGLRQGPWTEEDLR